MSWRLQAPSAPHPRSDDARVLAQPATCIARSAGQCVSRCRVASCRVFLVAPKVQPRRNAVMSPRSVHARVGLSRRARHFTRSTQNVHAAAHAGLARPTGASAGICACSKPAPLHALRSDAARPLRRTRASRLTFTTRYALTAHRSGAGCCARGKSRARACGLAYRAAGGSASLKAALPAWGATAARLLGKRFCIL